MGFEMRPELNGIVLSLFTHALDICMSYFKVNKESGKGFH
jgi:hypothetical protein